MSAAPTPPFAVVLADADERRRIFDALDGASLDELRVVRWLAERMRSGRERYAALHLATDPRDWMREAGEEAIDGLAYLAMASCKAEAERDALRLAGE